MISKLFKPISSYGKFLQPKRNFWAWLNIVFNLVDKKRIQTVGADRACAEWLLRNGAAVSFVGEGATKDYNSLAALPPAVTKKLQSIDASDASVTYHGFEHLRGCKYVENIKLHKNAYVDDRAIALLSLVRESIVKLEVTNCEEVTDKGVKSMTELRKLSHLTLGELGVKDWDSCLKILKKDLPQCEVVVNRVR